MYKLKKNITLTYKLFNKTISENQFLESFVTILRYYYVYWCIYKFFTISKFIIHNNPLFSENETKKSL